VTCWRRGSPRCGLGRTHDGGRRRAQRACPRERRRARR
jgi:hypothetical protein